MPQNEISLGNFVRSYQRHGEKIFQFLEDKASERRELFLLYVAGAPRFQADLSCHFSINCTDCCAAVPIL